MATHWPAALPLSPTFDDSGAPDALVCPITQQLMREPALVITTGRTYERGALMQWIDEHGTDPLDRERHLQASDLAPNLAVRQLVELWAREHGGLSSGNARDDPASVSPAPCPVTVGTPAATPAMIPSTASVASAPPAFRSAVDMHALPPATQSYSMRVLSELESGGRYFAFHAADLTSIVGHWASTSPLCEPSSPLPSVVKGGEGATFNVRNVRTGQTGGALFWRGAYATDGAARCVGCWNPADYAVAGAWIDGDEMELIDFISPAPAGDALEVASRRLLTATGWRLGVERLQFGESGLVGDWWKDLGVEIELRGTWALSAVRCDAASLPYSLEVRSAQEDGVEGCVQAPCTGDVKMDAEGWRTVATGLNGVTVLKEMPHVTAYRLRWASTDLHQTGGLSTARSGGGLHAEVLGFRIR